MNDKIRIKAITPYEGLRQLILKAANQYPEYEISVEFGNRTDCICKAKRAISDGYEVILSRGGTAEMLQKNVNIPVVSIGVSGYDILRTIRLAQNYFGKKAILGFESITHGCRSICELLEEDMEIHTLENFDEVTDILKDLQSRGITTVIGDTITVTHAEKLGLGSILLTSGMESVQASLEQAGRYVKYIRAGQKRAVFLEKIMRQSPMPAAAYDGTGEQIFVDKRLDELSALKEKLSELTESVLRSDEYFGIVDLQDKHFHVVGKPLEKNTAVFFCKEADTPQMEGLEILCASDLKKVPCGMFCTENRSLQEQMDRLRLLAKTGTPILLEGEPGTGKNTLASILCSVHSEDSPMICVNCGQISSAILTEVVKGTHPCFLNLSEYTLYFRRLDLLPSNLQEILLSWYPQIQNRFLLFSCETDLENLVERGKFREDLYHTISPVRSCIPSLRQRKEDLRSLSILIIGKINEKFGRQIVGLDKQAFHLIEEYPWEGNFVQLERILSHAAEISTGLYLTKREIAPFLSEEPAIKRFIDIVPGKTLADMEKEIIAAVFQDEGMNQVRTAARLGISRTTLWRYLQSM